MLNLYSIVRQEFCKIIALSLTMSLRTAMVLLSTIWLSSGAVILSHYVICHLTLTSWKVIIRFVVWVFLQRCQSGYRDLYYYLHCHLKLFFFKLILIFNMLRTTPLGDDSFSFATNDIYMKVQENAPKNNCF
jgi:hypothetical protein